MSKDNILFKAQKAMDKYGTAPVKVKVGLKFLVTHPEAQRFGELLTVSKIVDRYKSYRGIETVFAVEESTLTFDTFCGRFYEWKEWLIT